MLLRNSGHPSRRGATMVESALVMSVTFMLLIGVLAIGFGVFRYQQVAALAREGARYASVHGGEYAAGTGQPAATPADVYNQAILPQAIGLDPNQLTYSVTWAGANKMPVYLSDPANNVYRRNTITVTVTYRWIPEAYLGGMNLSSTSVMEMSY